jgi:OOP family OmpA-OmpF porin
MSAEANPPCASSARHDDDPTRQQRPNQENMEGSMIRSAAAMILVPALLLCACATHPETAATTPPPAPAGPPSVTPPGPERLIFGFGYASGELSPQAEGMLDQAGRLYRDGNPTMMTVSGHADATGDEYLNLILSARRAGAVKRGLVARGIPANKLELQAFGSSPPLVVPDPNSPENRAAVVTWR